MVNTMAEHAGAAADLGGLSVTTDPAGMLLGTDHAGEPVVLRLFRPGPTRIVLVDRWWIERILIFRSLALGARVVVHAPTPQQWNGFGEQATGAAQRFQALPLEQPATIPTTVCQPGLTVTEGPPVPNPSLGAWHTQVTVAPWFGEYLAQPVFESDLVILRRLSTRELAIAASMLRIDRWDMEALQTTPDDGVVLYRPERRQYVRVVPTQLEQQAFGTPRIG